MSEDCDAGRSTVGNSRTAMKPWMGTAIVTPPVDARPVVPLPAAETALSDGALPELSGSPPGFPLEPAVSPAAGTALSTPGPASVYVTTAPGAAAPEAPIALEGPAVQAPDADGIEPLLVVLDGVGSGVVDPLPATVTMPPVRVE
jgi:hypothetical protein